MTPRQILTQARAVIANRANWCQRQFALSKEYGLPYSPHYKNACQFCGIGAIRKVLGPKDEFGDDYKTASLVLEWAANKVTGGSFILVNDMLGHSCVLSVFDEAIASLPEEIPTHE